MKKKKETKKKQINKNKVKKFPLRKQSLKPPEYFSLYQTVLKAFQHQWLSLPCSVRVKKSKISCINLLNSGDNDNDNENDDDNEKTCTS